MNLNLNTNLSRTPPRSRLLSGFQPAIDRINARLINAYGDFETEKIKKLSGIPNLPAAPLPPVPNQA